MTSLQHQHQQHQTIVIELGSSRIKVGFAGESRPRRVLHPGGGVIGEPHGGCSWAIGINDGMGASPCIWNSYFRYYNMSDFSTPTSSFTTQQQQEQQQHREQQQHKWEKTLYPLLNHILTSILYIPRPTPRHRMIVVVNELYPPVNFREALLKVVLDYLGLGSLLIVGGAFNGGGSSITATNAEGNNAGTMNNGGDGTLGYILNYGLSSSEEGSERLAVGRPKAHLIVDIGTFEARVSVSVMGGRGASPVLSSSAGVISGEASSSGGGGGGGGGGSSTFLTETYNVVMSGYHSFLLRVLENYREEGQSSNDDDEIQDSTTTIAAAEATTTATKEEASKKDNIEDHWTRNATLEDANAIVQSWIALSSSSSSPTKVDESATMSVTLPCCSNQNTHDANDTTTGTTKAETGSTSTREIPIQPLLQTFHQLYLDYTNPSSLIYAMLTSIMSCPMDYRRVALENVILIGGGSVALRYFGRGLIKELEGAAREACGCGVTEQKGEGGDEGGVKEEEKKEDGGISNIARHRFRSLRGAIVPLSSPPPASPSKSLGGIHIQYPDPFAADLVSWIGGSVMGSLALKNEDWITKRNSSDWRGGGGGDGGKTPLKPGLRSRKF